MYIKYVANSILSDNTHSTFKRLENNVYGLKPWAVFQIFFHLLLFFGYVNVNLRHNK